MGEGLVEEGNVTRALDIQQERRVTRSGKSQQRTNSPQNIRVDLQKLDSLMNLVGELIVAENAVAAKPRTAGTRVTHLPQSLGAIGTHHPRSPGISP